MVKGAEFERSDRWQPSDRPPMTDEEREEFIRDLARSKELRKITGGMRIPRTRPGRPMREGIVAEMG